MTDRVALPVQASQEQQNNSVKHRVGIKRGNGMTEWQKRNGGIGDKTRNGGIKDKTWNGGIGDNTRNGAYGGRKDKTRNCIKSI